MASFTKKQTKEIVFFELEFLEKQAPVKAVYTSRIKGNSQPPYDSLNLGLHVGDSSETVLANRSLLAELLELPLENWVIGEQIHSNKVASVRQKDAGRGAYDKETVLKGIDAIVTNEPGLTLVTFYADCVPIFIVDPINRAIGLAHAGWRGTILQIGLHTVKKMIKEFGSQPDELIAAIGPAIGPCCYQIDNKVAKAVREHLAWHDSVLMSDGDNHYRLDLPKANYLGLKAAGLKSENISAADICTRCSSDIFFSYRAANGVTGRQAALLSLR